MARIFADLSVANHRAHFLHSPERDWPQTNCYVDLWIEVLHACGLPPEAALGFTVAQDFEGDQFTFFKFPLEDLETIFAIRVQELSIYEPVETHVRRQIERGRLCLVEVDAYFLPDTAGVSYRLDHSKTTIAINRLDLAAKQLDYFHNHAFFTLDAEDFDGVFNLLPSQKAIPERLSPYVEFAKLPEKVTFPDSVDVPRKLLSRHLARAPKLNPVRSWQGEIDRHVRELANRPSSAFHQYAFNTARQVGANFELMTAHLDWLMSSGESGLGSARDSAKALSTAAKSFQFQLARAISRRKFDGLQEMLDPLAVSYDDVMRELRARFPV